MRYGSVTAWEALTKLELALDAGLLTPLKRPTAGLLARFCEGFLFSQ
jgi:hypothetical protein